VGRINCFEWKILANLAFLLQCECVLNICMYQCQGSLFGRYCVLCCVESGLLLSSFSISYLWFASRMLRYLHMVSPASWFLVVLVVLTFSACLYHAVNSLEWDVNRLMITVLLICGGFVGGIAGSLLPLWANGITLGCLLSLALMMVIPSPFNRTQF
jgi:hypothetical protein